MAWLLATKRSKTAVHVDSSTKCLNRKQQQTRDLFSFFPRLPNTSAQKRKKKCDSKSQYQPVLLRIFIHVLFPVIADQNTGSRCYLSGCGRDRCGSANDWPPQRAYSFENCVHSSAEHTASKQNTSLLRPWICTLRKNEKYTKDKQMRDQENYRPHNGITNPTLLYARTPTTKHLYTARLQNERYAKLVDKVYENG